MPEFEAIVPAKRLDAAVDFDGETLEFGFDANRVTPEWFDEQQRGLAAGDVLTVARALGSIIIDWNLTIAGTAVVPDADVLARFPMGHLNALMEAIAEQPTRAEGEVSSEQQSHKPPEQSTDSMQPPLASQSAPPNGEVTSDSPKPSESLSPT